jgi:hypothetical protein
MVLVLPLIEGSVCFLLESLLIPIYVTKPKKLLLSWLQVLGSTKRSQINESEGHQFEPKMSNLESLKT